MYKIYSQLERDADEMEARGVDNYMNVGEFRVMVDKLGFNLSEDQLRDIFEKSNVEKNEGGLLVDDPCVRSTQLQRSSRALCRMRGFPVQYQLCRRSSSSRYPLFLHELCVSAHHFCFLQPESQQ